MADSKTNNFANVSDGRGVEGGYLFRAPLGSEKPTDVKTALGAAFKCCGIVSEDGIVFATETDREELKDMNGTVVHSAKTSHLETMTATLGEVKKETYAIQYGDGQVTDESGTLTVHVKNVEPGHAVYVFDGVLKNGRRWRRVVHDAQVTEMGDMTIAAGELMGREATFTCFPDAVTGDFYTDYIESTETEETA